MINNLPKPINQECVIRVVKVSGTIRKALEWLIMSSKEDIASLNARNENEYRNVSVLKSTESNGVKHD